jgi:hypothetical protein
LVNTINELGRDFLDHREMAAACRFARLMEESGPAINPLVLDILPVYYHGNETLSPDMIYRSLMYVYLEVHRGESKGVIYNAGQHVEGCLFYLCERHLPLGAMAVVCFEQGIIQRSLFDKLSRFNKAVSIPTKHMAEIPRIETRIDKRTFSYLEAGIAFMVMRQLSIALFTLLRARGVRLPEDWKEFKEEWVS